MTIFRVVLMSAAFACFVLNALNISLPRGNVLGLGLGLWVLAETIK